MKPENDICQALVPPLHSTQSRVKSDTYEPYTKAMRRVKDICESKRYDFFKFSITQQQKFSPFCYKVVKQMNRLQVISLDVSIGYFSMQINILNIDGKSPLVDSQEIGRGQYGHVHILKLSNQQVAIKSLHIQDKKQKPRERFSSLRSSQQTNQDRHDTAINEHQSFLTFFTKALKEYCLIKTSAAMECSPKMGGYLGFDLIVFDDCIQFAMQKCQPPINYSDKDYEVLLQNIGQLHRFKIVHRDINPKNIAYSRLLAKLVLIDFGFADAIQQDCGYKSCTSFRGTLNYVNPEMREILYSNAQYGLVDLYYNDVFGLSKSHEEMLSNKGLESFEGSSDFQLSINEKLKWLQINKSLRQEMSPDIYYLFILLRFEAYFRPGNLRLFLNHHRHIFISRWGRKTLLEISSLVSLPVDSSLIIDDLKSLSYLDQYTTLVEKLRYNQQAMEIIAKSPYAKTHTFIDRYAADFRTIMEDSPSVSPAIRTQTHQVSSYYKLVLKYLINKGPQLPVLDRSQCYSIVLDCLRFDRRNLPFHDKTKIAQKFLESLNWQCDKDRNQLSEIESTFKYFLKYCFSEPKNDWKYNNRYDVMFNAMLADTDYLEELVFFSQTILKQALTFQETFGWWYDFFMLARMYEQKVSFRNKEIIFEIITKVTDLAKALENKLYTFSQSKDKTENIVVTIVSLCHTNILDLCQFETSFMQYFSQVHKEQTKNRLLYLALYKIGKIAKRQINWLQHNRIMFIVLEKLKRMPLWVESLSEILLLSEMVQSLKIDFEMLMYGAKIRKTINFDPIFWQLLPSYYYLFLTEPEEYEEVDLKEAKRGFKWLVEACFSDGRIQLFIDALGYCINSITKSHQLAQQ